MLPAGWNAVEQGSSHESGQNPSSTATDRSASGWTGYNAESLALECGVSRRTIFRDLEVLRQSGIPLAFDERQQIYCIPGT